MKKHLDITISGKVQGVFFRQTAKEEAERLGLAGYARNMEDGSVIIEAEGEEESLKKLLEWCREGSQMAEVSEITHEFREDLKGYKKFEIKI